MRTSGSWVSRTLLGPGLSLLLLLSFGPGALAQDKPKVRPPATKKAPEQAAPKTSPKTPGDKAPAKGDQAPKEADDKA